MILEKIVIKKLFGMFDYEIKFNPDITIITAPNGYGKTYCLKIIHSIFSFNYFFLDELNFESISIFLGDNELKIAKKFSNKSDTKNNEIQESLFDDDGFIVSKYYSKNGSRFYIRDENRKEPLILVFTLIRSQKNLKDKKNKHANNNENYNLDIRKFRKDIFDSLDNTPNLLRTESNEWIEIKSDSRKRFDFESIIEEYGLSKPASSILPKWLFNFTKNTNSYFIQDQRLLKKVKLDSSRRDGNSYVQTILTYATELKNHIVASSLKFSAISQDLDSSFPKRLIDGEKDFSKLKNIDEIVIELDELQSKREQLTYFDILPKNNTINDLKISDKIKPAHIEVLNLYLEDTKRKLSEFDDIFNKISLFVKMLNAKLTFKKVKIDSDKGFYFIKSIDEIDDNLRPTPLNLSQLSSGEQHEVVLIYELIFNIEKGSLVLIDEPEISLHVVWQKQFLNDLKDIMEMNESDAIIATHSPQIIGNNWESVIDLQDLNKVQAEDE